MKRFFGACLCVGLLFGVACEDDPIETVDESMDCAEICDRYKECFDDNYDVDRCEDSCDSRADDPDHEDQEEACSNCIEGQSCTSSFDCVDEFAGIVP